MVRSIMEPLNMNQQTESDALWKLCALKFTLHLAYEVELDEFFSSLSGF